MLYSRWSKNYISTIGDCNSNTFADRAAVFFKGGILNRKVIGSKLVLKMVKLKQSAFLAINSTGHLNLSST